MAEKFSTEFAENLKKLAPQRPKDSHKGSFGRALLICGSHGMAGAAYLSALAAYRTGTGLVEIFTPEENRTALQVLIPEAILKTYNSEDFKADDLRSSIEKCDAVLIGCGLGVSDTSLEILKTVLSADESPKVIDADALNLLSENRALLKYAKNSILTPHLKEMSRLTDTPTYEIAASLEKTALDFSSSHSLSCVLKSHVTAVADKDGSCYLNTIGNDGMATAGSGDVLAGIIVSLLSQKHLSLSRFEAASLGVYLHAEAGDRAAKELGKSAVMARDIANNIRFQ